MKYKKQLLAFVILLVLFIGFAQAQTLKLELCTEDECYNYLDDIKIMSDKPLILKFTIINKEKAWMCWNGINYRFYLVSDNLHEGKQWITESLFNRNDKDITKFCFTNTDKEENILYIPFREYNEIRSESRLGGWKITDFKVSFDDLEYYSNVSLENPIYKSGLPSSFDGNEIQFSVIVEEPKKGWYGNLNKLFRTIMYAITGILGLIATGLWVYILSSNRKRKPYKTTIIISILFLILTGIGFAS